VQPPGELRGGGRKTLRSSPGLRLSTARARHATLAACARNLSKQNELANRYSGVDTGCID